MKSTHPWIYAPIFAVLTAAGAWLAIPIDPVPITLQTLFVTLAGLLLAPAQAALAMGLYVLMGVVGLPVFSDGKSGLGVLTGPTGGYLVGFIVAAWVMALLSVKWRAGTVDNKRLPLMVGAIAVATVGTVLIVGMGSTWGKVSTGSSWGEIWNGWIAPFIPGAVLKIVAAGVIAAELWRVDSRWIPR